MEKLKVFDEFYLDKEKDVIVKLYRISKDEIEYILETPNHKKGTLITNLAQICHLETEKNENDMKIIKGKMQAMINGENEEDSMLDQYRPRLGCGQRSIGRGVKTGADRRCSGGCV